jgi:hypothetical protein
VEDKEKEMMLRVMENITMVICDICEDHIHDTRSQLVECGVCHRWFCYKCWYPYTIPEIVPLYVSNNKIFSYMFEEKYGLCKRCAHDIEELFEKDDNNNNSE